MLKKPAWLEYIVEPDLGLAGCEQIKEITETQAGYFIHHLSDKREPEEVCKSVRDMCGKDVGETRNLTPARKPRGESLDPTRK